MKRIRIFLLTLPILLGGAMDSAAATPESLWIEAEHLQNIRGYCWPGGQKPKTNGHWGVSGPGWAAEWIQGGESNFMSIACGADDDKAVAGIDIQVPVAGIYRVWVRFRDNRGCSSRFQVRVTPAGGQPTLLTYGTKPIIEEDNEMKLYWNWAFAWEGHEAKLPKGKARLELLSAFKEKECRQVDCIVLTTDLAYRPLIKERPRHPSAEILNGYTKGIDPKLAPLARRTGDFSVPAAWKPRTFRDKGFLYLWNMGQVKWAGDDPKRVPFPYHIGDQKVREAFEKKYAGAKDVPIFSDPRIVPTFHGAGPNILATDAKDLKQKQAAADFVRWLDAHPDRPWAMMMNYAPDNPVTPAARANFLKYRDRYVGSIAGESVGYFYVPDKDMQAATAQAKTRRELAAAFTPLSLQTNAAKYKKVFGQDWPDSYREVIPCKSVGMTDFAPICYDWGARTVGYESSAMTAGLLSMRQAFLRGAARQNGGLTATYRSCNFGDASTIFSEQQSFTKPQHILDNYYSVFSGAGMTWYKMDICIADSVPIDYTCRVHEPPRSEGTAMNAYSYVRFSTPEQAKGDSLRRQTEAAAEWCKRHKVKLDESTTLHDLGKSAFTGGHRVNPDRHALAGFLRLVESGKVERGSYLILENLDRLSREHIQPAALLVLNLLQAGIRIVQLKPTEIVFDDKSDMAPVMMMLMELNRGHGESAIKSERIGKAWANKRARLRENGDILTRQLPAWIEEHDGALRLISERAATIRRIFHLAANGYSQSGIVRKLTEEKAKPFGEVVVRDGRNRSARAGKWMRAYIAKLLRDRRTLGEFQPRGKGRKPEGAVIKGYYPAAVTEQEFFAARAGIRQRDSFEKTANGFVGKRGGRQGRGGVDLVNLFAGMLLNARDGGTYYAARRPNGKHLLVNTGSGESGGKSHTFPYEVFEAGILACLKEIDPHEILNGDSGPDKTLALGGELAGVEGRIAELEGELLKGDVAALARVLRQLEERKAELVRQLTEAREKAAHPLSETWGEAQTLLDAIRNAPDPDDTRLRLRAALRRIVESVWVLVVPRGWDRLAAVQMRFAGKPRVRSWLILSRPHKRNGAGWEREGSSWVRSLAAVAGPKSLDLRNREDAKALADVLAEVDLEKLQ